MVSSNYHWLLSLKLCTDILRWIWIWSEVKVIRNEKALTVGWWSSLTSSKGWDLPHSPCKSKFDLTMLLLVIIVTQSLIGFIKIFLTIIIVMMTWDQHAAGEAPKCKVRSCSHHRPKYCKNTFVNHFQFKALSNTYIMVIIVMRVVWETLVNSSTNYSVQPSFPRPKVSHIKKG